MNSRRNNDERRNNNDERKPENLRRPTPGSDRRPNDERRQKDERKSSDSRRKNNNNSNDYDDLPSTRIDDMHVTRKEPANDQEEQKPTGGSIFERRIPPRINRPVPLDKRDKYAYNITERPKAHNNYKRDQASDDYYEEYEETPVVLSTSSSTTSTTTQKPTEKPTERPINRGNIRNENRSRHRNTPAAVYTTEKEVKLPEKVVESAPETEFYDEGEELESPVEYEAARNVNERHPAHPELQNSHNRYVDEDEVEPTRVLNDQPQANNQEEDAHDVPLERKNADRLTTFRTYNDRISKLPTHQSDEEKHTKFAPKQTTPEPITLTITTTERPRSKNKFTNYNPYKYTNINANHDKQSSPSQVNSEDTAEELKDLDAPQIKVL